MRILFTQVRIVARGATLALYLGILVAFGVLVPWIKGVQFLDPVIFLAYGCMGVVFAGPAASALFRETPASVNDAAGKILVAVLLGEAIVLVVLAAALVTVRIHSPLLFFLDIQALGASLALGLALSLALSALVAWIALTLSVEIARLVLRLVLLGFLATFFFRSRWLPDIAWYITRTVVAASVVLLVLLYRSVRIRLGT